MKIKNIDIKEIYFMPIFSFIMETKGEQHNEVNIIKGIKKYPSFISTEGESEYFKYDI
jgi:hypothetical protein